MWPRGRVFYFHLDLTKFQQTTKHFYVREGIGTDYGGTYIVYTRRSYSSIFIHDKTLKQQQRAFREKKKKEKQHAKYAKYRLNRFVFSLNARGTSATIRVKAIYVTLL